MPPFEICSLKIGYPGIPKSINLSWSSIAYLREYTKNTCQMFREKYPKTPAVRFKNEPQRSSPLPLEPLGSQRPTVAVVLVALGRFTHHHNGLAGEILRQVLRQRPSALRRDQVA